MFTSAPGIVPYVMWASDPTLVLSGNSVDGSIDTIASLRIDPVMWLREAR